jgi:glycosyltransferase involved in cell wall biosynthesis
MPEIRRAYPAALLVVAGSGALAESIERRITTLGLGQAVRLVGDVHGAELVNWIRSADLCVVPTQRPEPFGLATVEALACGTPVVATPSGASPELLEPLDPRLVLPGLRPADIARGIDGVLADSDLISTVRAKARAHVVPRFGWDRIADAWAEIYTEFEAS